MSEFNTLSKQEKEYLLSMLPAGKLDYENISRKFIGVSYGEAKNQKMNIYLPENGFGPFPVIFFLHGGGWQSGSRSDTQVKPFLHGINRGYAVISCDYRLIPEVYYPENLYDVKAALNFIGMHGSEYMLDTSRLVIAGASAGAHLALMAAFTQGLPAFSPAPTSDLPVIRAVIEQFGPTDFASENAQYEQSGYARMYPPAPLGQGTADRLLNADTSHNPALLNFLSPICNVHKDIPPVLILHGRFDPMVPYQQAVTLYDRICQVCGNDRAKLIISDDCTHADTKYESEPYTSEIFAFIEKYI